MAEAHESRNDDCLGDGLDNLLNRFSSRIFLSFAVCAVFFYLGKVDEETFQWALAAFAGVNGVEKICKGCVRAYRG